MLLQFSVENFRSFKTKAVLSLEASSDKELPNNVIDDSGCRALKVATIFGANAAGKSNIFKALSAAILLVRLSNFKQFGEALTLVAPFAFDDLSARKPSSFEFVFVVNGEKHVYGFSATREKIVEEYLFVYHSSRATTIFKRTESNQYTFTSSAMTKKLKPLTEYNTENKLFLATATAWNCEETRDTLLWFMEGINTYPSSYADKLGISGELFEQNTDGTLREFTNRLLHQADINISDYEFESREASSQPGAIPSKKEYYITTLHEMADGKTYSLNLQDESNGTVNLFFFSPIIKRAFETGETLCIDEFDESLHPILLRYLIGLFNDSDVNKKNAQLVVSTHTSNLLDLNLLRRDQIYFVEKERATGESTLYSLDEFSPRTREDVQKAYLLGRYGAIPNVGNGEGL